MTITAGGMLVVFPTRVGMNRPLLTADLPTARVPHTRGDEPIL